LYILQLSGTLFLADTKSQKLDDRLRVTEGYPSIRSELPRMSPVLLLLIIASVCCSAVAQLLLKLGMSQPSVAQAIGGGAIAAIAGSVATNVWVLGGLSLYFFGAVVWLFVLARLDLSVAYPFVGLGFIVTMLLGKLVMGDVISATRLAGTLLVAGGVVLIARS
jgi:drug/metabolite transporter (DMT)-like permease